MTVLFGLRQRLYGAKLYLITDARVASDDLGPFADAAFGAGVDMIGFRDENLSRVEALEQLALLRTLSYRTQGLVVVQDDPGLAEAFTADLLHLDENDTTPAEAKKILHKWALVGRGAHTDQQARAAIADDLVDFITIGPEHPTATAPDLVRTMADLAPPGAAETKPWFATGGTSLQDVDQVLAAGARRIVVGSEIRDAAGFEDAARAIRERIDAAWDADPAMEGYFFRGGNRN
ncbi:thiamine phosphate synthase [Enemella sp. A6]|uniref:thiamine phosphate synthase n=1 Tax=Enemella sp. A6 TaxID=3440152 RepID=UPI003EB9B8DD